MSSDDRHNYETGYDIGRFLIVDDEDSVRDVFKRILSMNPDWQVHACGTASEALEEIRSNSGKYDVIFTDLTMPGEDGFQFLDKLDCVDSSIVRIIVTGYATADNAIMGARRRVFDIIKKPVDAATLRMVAVRALSRRRAALREIQYKANLEEVCKLRTIELRETVRELKETQSLLIEKFAAMAEMRENETGAHGKRVARMFAILADKARVSPSDIEHMSYGALLHDIGKIAVPDAILLKEGPLTADEREIINQHIEHGARLLKDIPFLSKAADVVQYHHERYDGKGYPAGLAGDDIPLVARIFSVIDAYDVMRSGRPYRGCLTENDAVTELLRHSGTQFDPDVVNLFMLCKPDIEKILVS